MGAPIVVVDSFAAPSTLTRDLAVGNGVLWATGTLDGNTIYELDPADGSVISSFASPGISPFGIAWDGTNLWHSDANTDRIYKLTTAGSVVSSFAAPTTSIVSLDFDADGFLWAADSGLDQLHQIDPSDGSVIVTHSTSFPATYSISGVSVLDGDLWVSLTSTTSPFTADTIRRLAMADGSQLDVFDGNRRDLLDLSWDPPFLWVISIDNDTIYKTEVPGFPETARWLVGAVGFS